MPRSNVSRAMGWVLPAVLVGCLQDYDQFDFGAGGAGTTSAGGAGPATTGATMATGTTGTMSTTTTGSNTTTTTTTTTTATTTTGMGGMGPGVTVDCFGDTCDVDGGELCCAENAAMGMCETGACNSGGDIPITCDQQADCPGEICCVLKAGSNVTAVQCEPSCNGSNADPICGGADPCQTGICVPHGDLPGGYMNCE